MKPKQIWVDPKFHKRLKRKALDEELTILDLTKKLGREDLDQLEETIQNVKSKRIRREKFGFNI